jgi:large subunit ribosomal protein L23
VKAPQDIILKPIITEQSVDNMQNNKYTFKVAKDANKVEIAQAVQELFHVEVVKVNTLNCTGRTKRVGRFVGKKADYKKAIITINPETAKLGKDGKKLKSSIEFFDGMF